jgi:hypothetical protein
MQSETKFIFSHWLNNQPSFEAIIHEYLITKCKFHTRFVLVDFIPKGNSFVGFASDGSFYSFLNEPPESK